MTAPAKVHLEDPGSPKDRPWAWCSASIHGHLTTRRSKEVTCVRCSLKALREGLPRYRRWWHLRRRKR